LCAEKKALGPRKRLDCSTLQSNANKESANRDQAREGGVALLAQRHVLHGEVVARPQQRSKQPMRGSVLPSAEAFAGH